MALQSPSNREQDLSNYRPGYYESNLAEQHSFDSGDLQTHRPYIVDTPTLKHDSLEVLDESLRIEGMEKDLIRKSLQKHRGRRKDAADELGISERTLYRKIKQYDLN